MARDTYDLSLLRNGTGDPTTQVRLASSRGSMAARIERATLTPMGPGTVRVTIDESGVHTVDAWGDGAAWLTERYERLSARTTATPPLRPQHNVVERALHDVGQLRLPASDSPYHELLPAVLGQRITAGEALRQWATLCLRYGDVAPGPLELRLPPRPERLLAIPSWEFHRLGIEQQRARALRVVARHFSYVQRTVGLSGAEARHALTRLPGIGVWTAAVAVGVSHGDPDALPVGDFHVKNTVAWAFTGAPRGTDDEMLATLQPYAGQRWQVVRLLEKSGIAAPKFGPKRRNLSIARL